jgi:molybdate transport system substrate-binding protein
MKKILALAALLSFLAPAAADKPASTTLAVFAAASLVEPFMELGKSFEAANPGVHLTFNFAGSQQLRAQLEHGAPADLFASANTKEIEAAAKAGLLDPKSVRTFARNRLVVIHPAANPARLAALADLARPGVKLDLADEAVPVGQYTRAMLDKAAADPSLGPDFKTRVLKNAVSLEDNVKSIVAKVQLGEADAGVVYSSDAPAENKKLGTIAIPDSLNVLADYPIAVVAKSAHADLAAKFIAALLSPQGQALLVKHGFLAAPPASATPEK